ncbi:MAG TPA: hypothetical protein VN803_11170 [Gemmatimonadales bacterium]|nr:hypothetical protein [Gemmatimonadales bacterium]
MSKEELASWLATGGQNELTDAARQLADAVEVFRRNMVVATLFGGRGDASFKDGIRAIKDDAFLRDLEHFGDTLRDAARAQRSRIEVQRTGGSYGRGA